MMLDERSMDALLISFVILCAVLQASAVQRWMTGATARNAMGLAFVVAALLIAWALAGYGLRDAASMAPRPRQMLLGIALFFAGAGMAWPVKPAASHWRGGLWAAWRDSASFLVTALAVYYAADIARAGAVAGGAALAVFVTWAVARAPFDAPTQYAVHDRWLPWARRVLALSALAAAVAMIWAAIRG